MPYVFILLLIANILALGFFVFFNDASKQSTPAEMSAKSEISQTVSIENPNRSSK